jgi:hypothetical protein
MCEKPTLVNVKFNGISTEQSIIEEHIEYLIKNRENIALRNVSETEDYYSFLRGFDYVIDNLKYILSEVKNDN